MATPTEIAAYVGAAAWLPQIGLLIYGAAIKPIVTIVPEKQLEIGYTRYGPIFNIRLAISAAKKDTIIDQVDATLHHQDGSVHEFTWAGMKETFSEIRDLSGNMQFVEREYSPIALVLNRLGLIERFFRFQDPSFHSIQKALLKEVSDYQAYLKSSKPDYHQELLDSKQIHDLLEFYKQHFFWKTGKYTVTFSVKSPNRIVFTKAVFTFDLKSYEVEDLKKNIPLLKSDMNNDIKSDIPDYKQENLKWSWTNPQLERVV